jgi:hypothetical protein
MGILWEEDNFWVFVILTVILGGGAAYLTGRAMALTWRPLTIVIFYMGVLAAAVRFFHYALFYEPLLSLKNFIVDYFVVALACAYGYRMTRVRQMVEQYPWAYERSGWFWWRRRQEAPALPKG